MKKCVSILIILLGGDWIVHADDGDLNFKYNRKMIIDFAKSYLNLRFTLPDRVFEALIRQSFFVGGRKKYSGYSSFLKTYFTKIGFSSSECD